MVLTLESVSEIIKRLKATEQHFTVVLFVMLCKFFLTFKSVFEIQKCLKATEKYFTVVLSLCFTI